MAFAYKGFVPRFPLQSDEESHMSSWKVDDEEVKVGRQWWRALKVALSKERLEVKERVMGKELRAELEVEDHHRGKPTGSYPNINYINQASHNIEHSSPSQVG